MVCVRLEGVGVEGPACALLGVGVGTGSMLSGFRLCVSCAISGEELGWSQQRPQKEILPYLGGFEEEVFSFAFVLQKRDQ